MEAPIKTVSGNVDTLFSLTESSIYLMGFSFVLGSLFTILMLLILDFMRRNAEKK
ncbi:MAG: hypothetical protein MRY32_03590 [Rickettsiales bacterium]|nr:hypothetical protein [Rickettsiales bacterium]